MIIALIFQLPVFEPAAQINNRMPGQILFIWASGWVRVWEFVLIYLLNLDFKLLYPVMGLGIALEFNS